MNFAKMIHEFLERLNTNPRDRIKFFQECSMELRANKEFYSLFFKQLEKADSEEWIQFFRKCPEELRVDRQFTDQFFAQFKDHKPTFNQWKDLLMILLPSYPIIYHYERITNEIAASWLIHACDLRRTAQHKDIEVLISRERLDHNRYLPAKKDLALAAALLLAK